MENNLDDVVRKTATERMTTQRVANLQELMNFFDPDLGVEIGNFILGKLYSRSVIPWRTRQLCTIAALTVLYRPEQLRGHIIYALQAGVTKEEIGEVIIQVAIYGGFPAAIEALKVAKETIEQYSAGAK
jgi:alkylhydroperoxidase/carboxymuconolactone decarboxylase family protein YurZ